VGASRLAPIGQGLESGDIFGRGIQAHGVEARVVTILRQQLVVGAALDDTPLIH